MKSPSSKNPTTREILASYVGVADSTLKEAIVIINIADDEMKEQLRRGETKIHTVYKQIKAAEQREAAPSNEEPTETNKPDETYQRKSRSTLTMPQMSEEARQNAIDYSKTPIGKDDFVPAYLDTDAIPADPVYPGTEVLLARAKRIFDKTLIDMNYVIMWAKTDEDCLNQLLELADNYCTELTKKMEA